MQNDELGALRRLPRRGAENAERVRFVVLTTEVTEIRRGCARQVFLQND